MPTFLEIEEEIVRILSQKDSEVAMVPVPFDGSIAADGTTITAPYLDRGSVNSHRFDGRLIKVIEDATAVAYDPEVTVTGAHSATTTSITVDSTTDLRVGHVVEVGTTLEKLLIRAIVSSTIITVTRGWQGTTATAMGGTNTIRYDPFGFVTGVDNGGFAAGGIITVSPNFATTTGQLAAAAQYGAGSFYMYPKGLTPETVREKVNAVLRNTDGPHRWFPSLVTDSDMSSADLTNWDAVPVVTSPTTREFVVTPASVLYGERALHLVTDQLSSGAETEDFDVTENEQMIVHVSVRVVTGSVKVVLRRVTATATDLKTVTDLDERVYTDVFFRETMPDGIKAAALQFLAATAVSEYFVSPHVIVQSDRRRAYSVPSWWTRPTQLLSAFAVNPHYSSDVADSYISLSEYEMSLMNIEFQRSDRDVNPMRVMFDNHGSYPVGFMVQRPFAELTYDTANTVCDKDYVAFKTISNILRDRSDADWKHWAIRAQDRARMLGYGGRSIQITEQLTYAGA